LGHWLREKRVDFADHGAGILFRVCASVRSTQSPHVTIRGHTKAVFALLPSSGCGHIKGLSSWLIGRRSQAQPTLAAVLFLHRYMPASPDSSRMGVHEFPDMHQTQPDPGRPSNRPREMAEDAYLWQMVRSFDEHLRRSSRRKMPSISFDTSV
jgi:hypothetical protein